MAACGSLQHIFENPLPENPTLLESLSSWNQIKPVKPIEQPSFTEIFGELHFKENSDSSPSCLPTPLLSPSSSSSLVGLTLGRTGAGKLNTSDGSAERDENKNLSRDSFSDSSSTKYSSHQKSNDSFSSMNSDSLQLCTEGLGFESSDDVEELRSEMSEDNRQQPEEKISITKHQFASENQGGEFRRSKTRGGAFPPPISSISKSGKPWVCFKSFRQDGRFVLKEMRIPTHEFLHACREDGRLKLQFVQRKDEILEEEEEEEEDEDDDDDDEEEVEEEEEEEEEEDEDEEGQEEAGLEEDEELDDIGENDKDGKEDDNGVRNGEEGKKAEGNTT